MDIGRFKSYLELVRDAKPYLDVCNLFMYKNDLSGVIAFDHICVNCGTREDFDYTREFLETDPPSTFFFQTILASRRVAYVGLRCGLNLAGGHSLNCIELADTKSSENGGTCFHHAEIYPVGVTLAELLALLTERGIKFVEKQRPHHSTFDINTESGFIFRITQEPYLRTFTKRLISAGQ